MREETELGGDGQVVVVQVVDDDLAVPDLHELHALHLHPLAGRRQLGAVGQRERAGVCPDEHPLVGERVALLDVADDAMGEIGERAQLLGETVVDRARPSKVPSGISCTASSAYRSMTPSRSPSLYSST